MASNSSYNINKTIVSRYQWGKPSAAALKDAAKNAKLNSLKPEQLAVYNAIVGLFKGLEIDLYGNNRDKKSRYKFNFLINTIVQQISKLDMSSSQSETIQALLDTQTAGQKKALEAAIQDLAKNLDSANSKASSSNSSDDVEAFAEKFVQSLTNVSSGNDEFGKFLEQKLSIAVKSAIEDTVADSETQSKLGKVLIDEVRKELNTSSQKGSSSNSIGFNFSDAKSDEKLALLNKIGQIQSSLDAQHKLSIRNFMNLGKMSVKEFEVLNPMSLNTETIMFMTSKIMNKIGDALKKIGSGIWDAVTFPITLFRKFVVGPIIGSITDIVCAPFKWIGGMLSNILTSIKNGIWNTLKSFIKTPVGIAVLAYGAGYIWGRWIKPFYYKHIAPAVDWMQKEFPKWWDKNVKPALDTVSNFFKTTWKNEIVPLWNWFWNDGIPWIKKTLIPFWDEKIKPFLEWIGKQLGFEGGRAVAAGGLIAFFGIGIASQIASAVVASMIAGLSTTGPLLAALAAGLAFKFGWDFKKDNEDNPVAADVVTHTAGAAGATLMAAAKDGAAISRNIAAERLAELGVKTEKLSGKALDVFKEAQELSLKAVKLEEEAKLTLSTGNSAKAAKLAAESAGAARKAEQLAAEAARMKQAGLFERFQQFISKNKNLGKLSELAAKHPWLRPAMKWGGRGLFVFGIGSSAYDLYSEHKKGEQLEKQMEEHPDGNIGQLIDLNENNKQQSMMDMAGQFLLMSPDPYSKGLAVAMIAGSTAARGVNDKTEGMIVNSQEINSLTEQLRKQDKALMQRRREIWGNEQDHNLTFDAIRQARYLEIKKQITNLVATINKPGETGAWKSWWDELEDERAAAAARLKLDKLLADEGFISLNDFKQFEEQNLTVVQKYAAEHGLLTSEMSDERSYSEQILASSRKMAVDVNAQQNTLHSISMDISTIKKAVQTKPDNSKPSSGVMIFDMSRPLIPNFEVDDKASGALK